MSADVAVRVEGVSKRFRLYTERNQTLKAAMLRGGRARYEEFWALKEVDLEIPRGATFALIGENGSGKSTLLKCIARILRPDRGRITVTGKMSALLELGAGFHPELSGRENVYLNGSILGLSRRTLDERFDEIVDFAGLDSFIDSPVKNYSSGMYIRLAFAVAINVDPEVLLVDEVLAVGDEAFQAKCNERFAKLRGEGKTIVLVSHNLGAVRTMCEQAAWLAHGVVQDVGPPGRLIDQYVEVAHRAGSTGQEEAGSEPGAARWGSGEARVESVELIGADGQPARAVRMGDGLTVRLHYRCDQQVPRPVFGIGVHSQGGLYVSGINSRESCVPESIEGSGHMDFTADALPVLPGTYEISVTLMDHANLHVWDHRSRVLRFDVEPGHPRECEGVVALAGRWSLG